MISQFEGVVVSLAALQSIENKHSASTILLEMSRSKLGRGVGCSFPNFGHWFFYCVALYYVNGP